MPAVQEDVVERMTGFHRDATKRVVTKLHETPCPNNSKEIDGKTIGDILHMFWLDLKDFQNTTGPFDKKPILLTNTVLLGKSLTYGMSYTPYLTQKS